MGYKSRGNFALSLKISQEEFDNIFKKEEKKEEEVKPNKGCKYCNEQVLVKSIVVLKMDINVNGVKVEYD